MKQYVRFDWAMKKLLRDKTNFVVLEGFISTLLEKDIHITQLLESESNQDVTDDKNDRIDIIAEDSNGDKYIIELQTESEASYFQRNIFGTSPLLSNYILQHKASNEIKKVYSINIVFFILDKNDDYIYRDTLEGFRGINTGSILNLSPFKCEKFDVDRANLPIEYHILKIDNFNGIAKTPLEEWILFLKDETIPESPTAKGLAEAKLLMDFNRLTETEKRQYYRFLDYIVVLQDNILTARVEGRIEGHEEARKEEKKNIAQRMLKYGIEINTISEISELPIYEIQQL